jgi:hypothetical protein
MSLLAFGCGKSNENSSTQGNAPAAAVPAKAPSQDAKEVVTDFLGAFRKGDNEGATRLLTKVARQKVAETGRNVAPPANDRVKIEIDDPLYPTPDHQIAHVPTRWIDSDGMGHPRTDKATWVCRLEDDGWRVAGFAAFVFEGEEPLLLSFEEPEKMAEKQKWLGEEMERRAKLDAATPANSAGTSQAQTPQDAFRR